MQSKKWADKVSPHKAALLGLAIIIVGAAFPLENLSLRGANLLEKTSYAGYLCLSLWVLWRATQKGQNASFWAGLDALLLTYSIVPILQFALHLPRPQGSRIEVLNGFPSGHSVALFSLAWLLHLVRPSLGMAWFVVAGLIALSRVASEYHYDYQVVGGALMGLALGIWLAARRMEKLLTWRLWQRLERVFSRRTVEK